MFIVGLTGGIGSGKSAASHCFEQHGITVVDADLAARSVVQPGKPALEQIQQHFGDQLILANGELNRPALRNQIFNNPDDKRWLEELLHPLIRQQMETELADADSPYAILSAPLLIESGLDRRCHRVLVIDIPENLQIERTTQRDDNPAQQIQQIIDSQCHRTERLHKADDIIDNSGDLNNLQQQVERLHRDYLNYARAK